MGTIPVTANPGAMLQDIRAVLVSSWGAPSRLDPWGSVAFSSLCRRSGSVGDSGAPPPSSPSFFPDPLSLSPHLLLLIPCPHAKLSLQLLMRDVRSSDVRGGRASDLCGKRHWTNSYFASLARGELARFCLRAFYYCSNSGSIVQSVMDHHVAPGYFELLRESGAAPNSSSSSSGPVVPPPPQPHPVLRRPRPSHPGLDVPEPAASAIQHPPAAGRHLEPARHGLHLPQLSSLRRTCPDCYRELSAAPRQAKEGVRALIVAEPEPYPVHHRAKVCAGCFGSSPTPTKYWHGYYETSARGRQGEWTKHLDADFLPDGVFMVTKSFGIHATWSRKWRIRLYSHRSSFVGEGHTTASGHFRQPPGQPTYSWEVVGRMPITPVTFSALPWPQHS